MPSRRLTTAVSLLCALATTACGDGTRARPAGASAAPRAAAPVPRTTRAAAPVIATTWCGIETEVGSEDESMALACSRGRAWRRGDTLFVRLDSGPTRTFVTDTVDAAREEEWFTWEYVGALAGPFGVHHLLRKSHYTTGDSELALVSGHGAGEVAPVDRPVPSPDGARFASAYANLTCDARDTRLEIWRMASGPDSVPVREFVVKPYRCNRQGWGPSDVVWQGPDTLRFVANEPVDDDEDQAAENYMHGLPVRKFDALLVRTADGWKLVGAPRPPRDSDQGS